MSKSLESLSKIAKRIGKLKVDENGNMYNSLEDMYEPYKDIEKVLHAFEVLKFSLDMFIDDLGRLHLKKKSGKKQEVIVELSEKAQKLFKEVLVDD